MRSLNRGSFRASPTHKFKLDRALVSPNYLLCWPEVGKNLSDEWRLYFNCAFHFDAERWQNHCAFAAKNFEHYEMIKRKAAEAINNLKGCAAAVQMQERLISEVITPLKGHINLRYDKQPEELKNKLNPFSIRLPEKSSNTYDYINNLGVFYRPLLEVAFPEVVAKCRMFSSYLFLKFQHEHPSNILDAQSIYASTAAQMRHIYQSVKSMPDHNIEKAGLMKILEHNCSELDYLKDFEHAWKEEVDTNSVQAQTVKIEEVLHS